MSENINTPNTVGIIMDGNRRWARERNLPLLEGHRAGTNNLLEVVRAAKELGVKNIIFYTFSTENWNRAAEEVDYLMTLFREYFKNKIDKLSEEGACVRMVGEISRFSKDIQESILTAVEKTKNNNSINVYFALNYGGRTEILLAVKKILKENPKEQEITEEYFTKHLQTYPMPDPDIIIRTSGEQRLSGFLPWQCVYSELFFINTFWPDFSKKEFENVLREYSNRDRRIGK